MSIAHLYQDFGPKTLGRDVNISLNDVEIENQKLDSFEKGYQAGWDDAVNAQVATKTRISSDLAKNLQEVSFSYHEARSTLTKSLEPLFSDVVATLLPEVARHSLGPHLVAQLTDMVRVQTDQVIEITVSPVNLETIETLIENELESPFVMVPDPNLSEGQVFLRIGVEEREIDLDHVIETVGAAFNNFFTATGQDS
ncbi:ABC transporter ATP-binding protein [Ascidiaceihabitans sp.]|uniref:ABC transporter ATP-binding protein n=1 Tax=Ascidiaceihabitans sp. TaxID=1872644 RepID=UPI003296A98A